jgi:hypothetical protein
VSCREETSSNVSLVKKIKLGGNVMMKTFGLAAACLLVASVASAQVQTTAPGSGAANNAGAGYNQTQTPPASGTSAGTSSSVQNFAPGSGAGNNAAAGYAQTQQPANSANSTGGPAAPVQNFAPGSGASNNAVVGHGQK